MKSYFFTFVIGLGLLTLAFGCGEPAAKKDEGPPVTKVGKFTQKMLENGEPSHITVQHLLIAFDGSIPKKKIGRTKEEAEKFARKLYEEAKSGGDFDLLVEKNTDDQYPGIYHMSNFDQKFDMNNMIPSLIVYPRDSMMMAFGDVGFPLEVGEVGLAEFDKEKSQYGWHIIRRIQ